VKRPGVGSGIIVRSDGFILTNDHVVDGGKVIKVGLPGGKQYTARLWKQVHDKDLALLKIEASALPVAHMGNSDRIKLAQTVIAIGDPLGFSGTVTVGAIGGIGRDIKVGGVTYVGMIQTDAAINPGSSGGALINLQGEVIGINSLIYTGNSANKPAQGLAFAIPINQALKVARTMVANRPNTAGKPWIGITGEPLTPELATGQGIPARRGVLIMSVMAGSPAEASALMTGDAIVALNGKTVLNVLDFNAMINSFKPGQTVTLGIWRRAKKMSVQVTLDVANQ
jgi:serine protease Do